MYDDFEEKIPDISGKELCFNNNTVQEGPIYVMSVELQKGNQESINIFKNSNPDELAYEFCRKHSLDFASLSYWTESISKLMEANKGGPLSKEEDTINSLKQTSDCIPEVDEEDIQSNEARCDNFTKGQGLCNTKWKNGDDSYGTKKIPHKTSENDKIDNIERGYRSQINNNINNTWSKESLLSTSPRNKESNAINNRMNEPVEYTDETDNDCNISLDYNSVSNDNHEHYDSNEDVQKTNNKNIRSNKYVNKDQLSNHNMSDEYININNNKIVGECQPRRSQISQNTHNVLSQESLAKTGSYMSSQLNFNVKKQEEIRMNHEKKISTTIQNSFLSSAKNTSMFNHKLNSTFSRIDITRMFKQQDTLESNLNKLTYFLKNNYNWDSIYQEKVEPKEFKDNSLIFAAQKKKSSNEISLNKTSSIYKTIDSKSNTFGAWLYRRGLAAKAKSRIKWNKFNQEQNDKTKNRLHFFPNYCRRGNILSPATTSLNNKQKQKNNSYSINTWYFHKSTRTSCNQKRSKSNINTLRTHKNISKDTINTSWNPACEQMYAQKKDEACWKLFNIWDEGNMGYIDRQFVSSNIMPMSIYNIIKQIFLPIVNYNPRPGILKEDSTVLTKKEFLEKSVLLFDSLNFNDKRAILNYTKNI